jgi:PhnB protein
MNSMSRTSTYLNFPGNTEEAFKYYRSIFGGDFTRGGITRFRDIPHPEGIVTIREED